MPSLEALERNDVARLPGGIFLRAFVRAYAREVGLDAEDTVRRFVARFPDAAAVEELSVHEPVQERTALGDEQAGSRVWRVVGWSLPLVLVIVYFGFGGRLSWFRDQLRATPPRADQQAEQAPPASETPVMTTPAVLPPEPGGAATAAATGAVPPPAGGDAAAVSSALETTAGAGPDPVRAASAPAGAAPESRPSETITAPATEGRFSMTLTPSARCWVTVRSNGKVIFSGTMQPGDRQKLVLGGNVSLTVGNAAAMAVEIDGTPARPLGGEGQVRTILLNAQNLKDFLQTR